MDYIPIVDQEDNTCFLPAHAMFRSPMKPEQIHEVNADVVDASQVKGLHTQPPPTGSEWALQHCELDERSSEGQEHASLMRRSPSFDGRSHRSLQNTSIPAPDGSPQRLTGRQHDASHHDDRLAYHTMLSQLEHGATEWHDRMVTMELRCTESMDTLQKHVKSMEEHPVDRLHKRLRNVEDEVRTNRRDGYRNIRYESKMKNLQGFVNDLFTGRKTHDGALKSLHDRVAAIEHSNVELRKENLALRTCVEEMKKQMTDTKQQVKDGLTDVRIELYRDKLTGLEGFKKRSKRRRNRDDDDD